MSQTKPEAPEGEQPWEVETSAPTVPLSPKGPLPPLAEPIPGSPLLPPVPPSALPVDPQAETLLPEIPPKQRSMVIEPAVDRTSRSHRARTQTRQVTGGPSNLILIVLWTIALLSVGAAAVYFVFSS